MYQEHDGKSEKNKFESSISELKKKTFVTAADIESYSKFFSFIDKRMNLLDGTGRPTPRSAKLDR